MTSIMQNIQIEEYLWLLGHRLGHISDYFKSLIKASFEFLC